MSESLRKSLALVAKAMNAQFRLNDKMISYDEVFADVGLLPGLVKRADQLASLCIGYGLGATYEDTEGALLGHRVLFDEVTPNSLRLICIVDVLNEIMRGSPSSDYTPLDELMYD